jgi:hypothetical protein
MCQLQDTSLSHTLAKDKHRILGDRYNVLNFFTSKDGFNSCRMTEVNHQEKRVMIHLLESIEDYLTKMSLLRYEKGRSKNRIIGTAILLNKYYVLLKYCE